MILTRDHLVAAEFDGEDLVLGQCQHDLVRSAVLVSL